MKRDKDELNFILPTDEEQFEVQPQDPLTQLEDEILAYEQDLVKKKKTNKS